MHELTLGENQANRRLDRVLLAYLARAPHSQIYKMLRKKRIKLNGQRAHGNEITGCGDVVRLYFSEETMKAWSAEKPNAPQNHGAVNIIYEDKHIILADKPAGLLSHSDKAVQQNGEGTYQDTMIDRLAGYLSESSDFKPALCNRLDRNTSGLVACGKNMAALQALNKIFAERQVEKTYLAVVHGKVEKQKGELRGHLLRDKQTKRSYISWQGKGDKVHTEYELCQANQDYSLLKIKLHTGKAHQIRAHLASIGHPLAGDKKYGGKSTPHRQGQLLHCTFFHFKQINSSPLEYLSNQIFKSPPPKEIENFLKTTQQ